MTDNCGIRTEEDGPFMEAKLGRQQKVNRDGRRWLRPYASEGSTRMSDSTGVPPNSTSLENWSQKNNQFCFCSCQVVLLQFLYNTTKLSKTISSCNSRNENGRQEYMF